MKKAAHSLSGCILSGPYKTGAVLCLLAALPAAIYGFFSLLTPEGSSLVRERIVALGISGTNERNTWFLIVAATRLIALLAPLITGAFLAVPAIAFRRSRLNVACSSLSVLARICRTARLLLQIIAILLAALFVYRFTAYTIAVLREDLWIYLLLSMILGEGICGTAAFFLWRWFDRFFREAADTCDALAYCAISETPDRTAVSPYVFQSLSVFSVISLLLIPLRGMVFSAFALYLPVSAGNLLLSLSLRRIHSLSAQLERQQETSKKPF